MVTDADYDNSAAVPEIGRLEIEWAERARAFREALGERARLGLPYGVTERERADLFLPDAAPLGLTIFVHGGYWRSRHRHEWSHFAGGALCRGDAVALPSYTLAPEARVSRITLQIARAVARLAEEVPSGPIRLVGHSAGGHLVARMLLADAMLPAAVAERLSHVMPISPVSDLRPLVELSVNDDLQLTPAEAIAESPVLHQRAHQVPTTVVVGGAELPAFLDQAHALSTAWQAPLVVAEGRHHFDVIDDLLDPESVLVHHLFST